MITPIHAPVPGQCAGCKVALVSVQSAGCGTQWAYVTHDARGYTLSLVWCSDATEANVVAQVVAESHGCQVRP
jgi:hypothetical protein